MAMEINGNYSYYGTDYEEQMKTRRQEKANETEKEEAATDHIGKIPVPRDEYISSEESDRKPTGLYRLGQDENGNPKVWYDDPKKPANAGKGSAPEAPEEKCTGSTDQVDREIKQLKEEKKQLEQQIKTASGDEEKLKELEQKLAQVESELTQKDNDTYRRQHTVFTGTQNQDS